MYCFIFSYYKLYIFLFILTMKGNAMFLHIVGMIVFSKLLRTKIVYLNWFVQHIWKQYWGWRYRKNKHSWRFKDMYIWFDKHHYFMINSWSLPKVLNTSLIYHAWIEVTMFIREMYVQIYLFSFVTLSKEKNAKQLLESMIIKRYVDSWKARTFMSLHEAKYMHMCLSRTIDLSINNKKRYNR